MTLTPIERAQARLRLISQREQQILELKRLRKVVKEQLAELRKLDSQHKAILKNGARMFYDSVREYEGELIAHALLLAGGSITRAAPLLGLSYQTLGNLLDGRHKAIAHLRKPRHTRRARKHDKIRAAQPLE